MQARPSGLAVEGRTAELRPFTDGHREAVLRVLAARDTHDFGVADFTRKIVFDHLRTNASNAVVAADREEVFGCAAVHGGGSIAFVDPARECEGTGSALLAWTEAQGTTLGRDYHRQWIPDGNGSAQRLMRDAGYEQVRTIYHLVRELPGPPELLAAPQGIRLERPDLERDARALHAADAAAFAANADYRDESFETFLDEHLSAAAIEPELSLVARRGQAVAGFTVCRRWGPGVGYIDLLAVTEPERRQGLGSLLLLRAFADFARVGLGEATLDVASDNQRALRVYERAGMTPRHRIGVFEKRVAGA
jgi:mycothiol synthase